MEPQENSKPAQVLDEAIQIFLWDIVSKETEIFVRASTNLEPYVEDLRTHAYLKIRKSLKPDISSMGENERRQYLKAAAKNQLKQCARDINSPKRHSVIKFLNSVQVRETDDGEGETVEEIVERRALEAWGGASSPAELLESKERLALIEHLLADADSRVRALVSARLAGEPIKTATCLDDFSESTAYRLLKKFRVYVRKALS